MPQPVRRPGKQGRHGAEHDGHTERQADSEFTAEVADFCRPRQALVVDGVVRVGAGNGIADVLDLAADGRAIQRHRVEMHGRFFGSEIDLRLLHAGEVLQGLFDTSGAAGAVHAADGQIKALCRHTKAFPRQGRMVPGV